ncbi:uncharacterized protein LOC121292845 [Carcharodon carcharias]|uniref:uncharacterized protein LOC121292845 n=1 Tax=Carcharodon carcharias TaxID=13397 RepID=UPI001B7DEC62|nr:uncharacterized protein LOC121292845 [Carcharodon carcharias]
MLMWKCILIEHAKFLSTIKKEWSQLDLLSLEKIFWISWSFSGNESQDMGEEDLENQKLSKRLSASGADKDIHVSGVSVSLEKMTTEEVCEWLIDSGFQSCVRRVKELGITGQHLANIDPELVDQLKLQVAEDRQHLLVALYQQLNPSDMNVKQILGDQNKTNEQQVEEPWTMKERCNTSGSDKGTDTSGAAIPLERMTTDEVCKWLTDSGFEAYVPHIRDTFVVSEGVGTGTSCGNQAARSRSSDSRPGIAETSRCCIVGRQIELHPKDDGRNGRKYPAD